MVSRAGGVGRGRGGHYTDRLMRARCRAARRRRVALLVTIAVLAGCAADVPRPVVLVTVDALRRDRVGAYGRAPRPTPNMDGLARAGALVEDAVAPFGRTTQGVGSILSGLHPLAHGADGLGMTLPDRVTTLAEILRERGYRTAAFTSNAFLRPGLGFEQGFQIYADPRPRWEGNSAEALTDESLAWLAERSRSTEPWLLWVHYLDPHWTYEPPPDLAAEAGPPDPVVEKVAQGFPPTGELIFRAPNLLAPGAIDHVRRLYDAEVAATDRALGRLLAALPREAIVVLTADHGESLGEHGYYFAHGEYVYEPSLRVPLAVRAAGLIPAGTRVTGTVPLESVTPTLLGLLRAPVPEGLDGLDLSEALVRGGSVAAPPVSTVHLADHVLVRPENPRRPVPGREGRWWALRDGTKKLIRIPVSDGRFLDELYDLAADPGELRDLAAQDPATVARMVDALKEKQRALLARWQTSGATDARSADDAGRDTLKSLGYAH